MTPNHRLVTLLAVAAVVLSAGAANPSPYAPNHVIVKFRMPVVFTEADGTVRTGLGAVDALSAKLGVARADAAFPGPANALARRMGLDRIFVLVTHESIDPTEASLDYSALSEVEYAEPDYVGHAHATVPDDPSFTSQWGLNNTGQNPGGGHAGTPGADIDAERAWDIERGSRDIIIGHLDTGIDLDHPDVVSYFQAGVVWRNYNEIPANNIDDDNNGYIDDTLGWNFADSTQAHPQGTNNPQDNSLDVNGNQLGHGTHVAGIIGAHTDNGRGVAGTSWYCRIMPIKVLNQWGSGYYSWWCKGIYYAVNNGARIINMSLGGTAPDNSLQSAVNFALNSGVIVIASMGNDNNGIANYPAAYDGVIAVGMTDNDDARVIPNHNGSGSYGSNYGSWIDVMAPGNWTYSTAWDNTYRYMVGTSMAAPFVSGTAALMLGRNPDLTSTQVGDILRSTAEDLGDPGFDIYYGYGRINAYQALQQVQCRPGWTDELLMATAQNGAYEADVAVSGQNVHVVYTKKEADPDWGIWYVRSTDGGRTFGTPRKLSTCQANWVSYYPHVAASGARVCVVFQDTRSTNCGIYLVQSTDNGNTWWADYHVSDPGVVSYAPDVCLANDTIHVVWNTGYRRSTTGGSFWDAVTAGVSGQAIACANGRVFVTGHTEFGGIYTVFVRRYNAGAWEGLTSVENTGNCWPNPDVAADGDLVYVAWDQDTDADGTSEEIRVRKSANGGSIWSPNMRLAVLGDNYTYRAPRLAAGSGRVNLVWWGDRDQYWSCDVYWRGSTDQGSTWSRTQRLCYNDYNDFDELPAVACFADTVHVVWDRMSQGTKSVYYIRKGIGPSHDVGAYRIVTPTGTIAPNQGIIPQAMVRNYGESTEDFTVRFTIGSVYTSNQLVSGLAAGDSALVSFAGWDAVEGSYTTACSTLLATDVNHSDDACHGSFTVSNVGQSQVEPEDPIPSDPSGKSIKDGGWLAAGDGADDAVLFAAKGNRTRDFYACNPASGSWTRRCSIPDGREGKPPKKGAVGVVAGGHVYMVKGNNTLGFWRYDITANTWQQLDDVPPGGNKVKGGTDLVRVNLGGTDYLYLLKGIGTDFVRYNTAAEKWETRASAPAGAHPKWSRGSWLAADPSGAIYAHKGRYQELYTYDPTGDAWSSAMSGMPLAGMLGRDKKTGDGGCATWHNGAIYALKGNNTQEFWKYIPSSRTWLELDTIPRCFPGSTRAKKVKAGADIAALNGTLYLTKGNGTNEVWSYSPTDANAAPPSARGREGIMAGPSASSNLQSAVSVSPNPVLSGSARLHWNPGILDPLTPALLSVFDATGRLVLTLPCLPSTDYRLPHLASGVYVAKLVSPGHTTETRFVVQN